MTRKMSFVLIAAAATAIFFGGGEIKTADAFSTGGHFVITQRALSRAGFKNPSIHWVQAASYLSDELSNYPDIAMLADGDSQRTKNLLHFFHFDSLGSPRAIERELAWQRLAVASVVRSAAQRRDAKAVLNTLGIMSHAIQDFYSHSNFADMDWVSYRGYRIVTFSDVQRDTWDNVLLRSPWASPEDVKGLLSGAPSQPPYVTPSSHPSHGGGNACTSEGFRECGVNHDSAQRRNSLTAMLMAEEATIELVAQVRAAIGNDPAFWGTVLDTREMTEGVSFVRFRAQTVSKATGQWGYPHGVNAIQVALTSSNGMCVVEPCLAWAAEYKKTAADLFVVALPGFATGGGAPKFPASGTIFELPSIPPGNLSAYVGSYTFQWGVESGTMQLSSGSPTFLTGTIALGARSFTVDLFKPKGDGGFDINARNGASGISGTVYPLGSSTALERQLAGYWRDERGIPDGVALSMTRNLTPTKK